MGDTMPRTRFLLVLAVCLTASGVLCLGAPPKLRVLTLKERNAGVNALDEARNLFEKYRAMHPAPVDRTDAEEADFAKVLLTYETIIKKYENSEIEAGARRYLFLVYQHRGDDRRAIEQIETIARRFAGTHYVVDAYRTAGIHYLQNRHDPAAAIRWFEKVPLPEVRHPDTIKRGKKDGRWTVEDEARWRNDRNKAMDAYSEARALHVGILQSLAKCDVQLGNPDAAAGRYDKLMKLFPEKRASLERSLREEVRRPLTDWTRDDIHPVLRAWLAEREQVQEAAEAERWGKETRGVRCLIEMKPAELRIGDPFVINVKIRNVSDKPVTFRYSNLYQTMRLEVKSETGNVLKTQLLVRYKGPHPKTHFRRIEPGKTFTSEMKGRATLKFLAAKDLPKDPSDRPVLIDFHDVAHHSERPGRFTATLRLKADDKTVKQGKAFGFDAIWSGELASNTVTFTIRRMTREELDALIAQVRFGNEKEKRAAIDVLSANADRKAVPALMGIMTEGKGPYVRVASDALIRVQDTSVIPDLLALYRLKAKYGDARSGELHATLLRTIGGLEPDKRKLGDLYVEVLKSDTSISARNTAAWSLAMHEHPQALEALVAVAKKHEPRMQLTAINALTTFGHRRGREKVVAPLREVLKTDPNSKVRGRAAYSLGQLGDKSAVPLLIEALKDEDRFAGAQAAHAMGALADADVIPALEAYERSASTAGQKRTARGAIERIRRRASVKAR